MREPQILAMKPGSHRRRPYHRQSALRRATLAVRKVPRRMRRYLAPLLSILLVGVILGSSLLPLLDPRPVFASPDEAAAVAAIKSRLSTFFVFMDSLSAFEELGEAIPLTDFDPSDSEALNLAAILADADADPSNSLEDKVARLAGTSFSALETAIEGADDAYGNVDVAFDDVSVTESGGNVDVAFTLRLARDDVTLPVSFAADPIILNGGGIEMDFALSMPLSFQLDPTCQEKVKSRIKTPIIEDRFRRHRTNSGRSRENHRNTAFAALLALWSSRIGRKRAEYRSHHGG